MLALASVDFRVSIAKYRQILAKTLNARTAEFVTKALASVSAGLQVEDAKHRPIRAEA